MSREAYIFVGTLYSGENEFQQCVKSLHLQNYGNWVHEIYEDLPNKLAHITLYKDFMERSNEFDIFLKLDADMVFVNSEGLNSIVKLFEVTGNLDHLQMVVRDWYSDSLIMGIHAFSSRARWNIQSDLFVDRPPMIPGLKKQLWSEPAPFVLHSPDPSSFQAFRFGVHRASKVIQRNTEAFSTEHSRIQWRILASTWDHFQSSRDVRLGLALIGAEMIFDDTISHIHYDFTARDQLEYVFKKYENSSVDELHEQLLPLWCSGVKSAMRFYQLTGHRYLTTSLARSIRATYRRILSSLATFKSS